MKSYLLYVSQLYSLAIMRPLQEAIWKKGDQCAWFFESPDSGSAYLKDNETLLETVDAVKNYNPTAVFVPGNIVPDFFPGVKVQIFHGLATDETGKKGHYRIRGFFDLYCTRNPQETQKFGDLSHRYRHFRVVETGWPKLDPLFKEDQARVRALKDKAQGKPVIFYASTFSPSLTSAPEVFEEIRRLSQSGQWHWLVTLHPKMNEQIVKKYRDLQSDNLSFFESHIDPLPLMRAADVMLCDTSSIAIEFQLLRKPLVTYCTKFPDHHMINVTDPQSVEAALSTALTRPAELMAATESFAQQVHPRIDGCSSERVLNAVEWFLDRGHDGLKRKPLNWIRKIKIRRALASLQFY